MSTFSNHHLPTLKDTKDPDAGIANGNHISDDSSNNHASTGCLPLRCWPRKNSWPKKIRKGSWSFKKKKKPSQGNGFINVVD